MIRRGSDWKWVCWPAGVLLCVLLLVGCRGKPEDADSGLGMPVFVSIPPQKAFVRAIGGTNVRVESLIGPGQDPHSYDPTVKQWVRLSNSQIFFTIGVPFELTLLRAGRDELQHVKVVDVSEGIKKRTMEEAHGHEEDHEGPHGTDPHVWLAPKLVKAQITPRICQALGEADPKNRETYHKNLEAYQAKLNALDAEIAEILKPYRGRDIFVFHPAFGYFCDAYGLKQRAVQAEGKAPSQKRLAELIALAKQQNVRAVFTSPEFSSGSVETFARAIGAEVHILNPLAEDYEANLLNIARTIAEGLGK